MKKILRLVTTSVLTLTLVACGEASSSVSSSVSSSASSSVASSSVASSFAAVTSITLAPAATDALTQVVGSLKTVVINASFNTGVNPDLRVSWLVNGVESKQTGRAFEFTPTAAGVFKIKARVGTVESQEQTVTVTAQGVSTLSITSHEFVSTTRLEVVATGGATVVVTGATLDKDASFYDHIGIDIPSILRALEVNIKNKQFQQGGSTITQQLARNVFLDRDKNIKRKILDYKNK
jgi:membrane carboxypeptidase/penicillin-binding protein PbpC